MALLLIHSVRTVTAGRLEPVGAWRISEEAYESFYPDQNTQFEGRGRKALFERPMESLLQWAEWKAHSSPNWRVWTPNSDGDSLALDNPERELSTLQTVFESAHAAFVEQLNSSGAQLVRSDVATMPADVTGQTASIDYEARAINVHSWWLAAEFARRHPELLVYEMHPGGGMYDMLAVASPEQFSPDVSLPPARVMLNRVGSLQVHSGNEQVVVAQWKHLVDPAHRWEVLKQLELHAGLPQPEKPAASTPRTLTYRFLAAALELCHYHRLSWDVRSEFLDTAGYGENPDHLRHFPSAIDHLMHLPRLGIHGEPQSHFWTLLREQEAIETVSIDGTLHLRDGKSLNLIDQYQKHGRRLRWMTASLLRDWL